MSVARFSAEYAAHFTFTSTPSVHRRRSRGAGHRPWCDPNHWPLPPSMPLSMLHCFINVSRSLFSPSTSCGVSFRLLAAVRTRADSSVDGDADDQNEVWMRQVKQRLKSWVEFQPNAARMCQRRRDHGYDQRLLPDTANWHSPIHSAAFAKIQSFLFL